MLKRSVADDAEEWRQFEFNCSSKNETLERTTGEQELRLEPS